MPRNAHTGLYGVSHSGLTTIVMISDVAEDNVTKLKVEKANISNTV